MKISKRVKIINMSLIVTLMTIGCQSATTPYTQQKVITVGEDEICMDEMMYHVMIAEFQGKVISSYFGDEAAYWSSEYEQGISMSENKQQQIIEDVIKYQIYYNEAQKEGLTLDEGEKAQVKQNRESIEKNIGVDAIKTTQLSSEKMESIAQKIALATKYYNLQVAKTTVDEQAIRSSIHKEDYEIYKFQYVFMPNKSKKDNGQIQELGSLEMERAYQKMEHYKTQLATLKDVEQLAIEEEDKDKIQTGETSFNMKENPFGEETEIIEQCKKLNSGDTSEVFTTKHGYYVIRRISDPVDPYEQAVKEAKDKEIEDKVKGQYETLKQHYKIDINDNVWKKVHIGSMTTTKTTQK